MAEGHTTLGRNRLLDTFRSMNGHAPLEGLESVSLILRQKLYTPYEPIEHIYFPVNGVVSMLAEIEEGSMVEVATIGNEGMIGLPLFLGADTTPGTAFSQVPGDAFRIPAQRFKRQLREHPALVQLLHRYTQALMTQISQGTACNRIHNNLQRCARWLLLTHDRVGQDEFYLTQEFLSQMLGVRRASVNEIAGELHRAGAIDYTRGVIHVLDRTRLESAACKCYSIIRDEYDRMYASFSED